MNHQETIDYLATTDLFLAQLIEQHGICQLGVIQPQSSLFEALAWAIISQQISTKAAHKIYQRFSSLYCLEASIILQIPEEQLQSIGISRYKVSYLKNLAQHIESGLPTLTELEKMNNDEIIQTLTSIKGIGVWTVQMLLIFRLHRLDILPSGDLGIRQAIKKLYNLPELPSPKIVEAMGQKWTPYRTIASWYLWRSLSDSILAIQL